MKITKPKLEAMATIAHNENQKTVMVFIDPKEKFWVDVYVKNESTQAHQLEQYTKYGTITIFGITFHFIQIEID